MLIKSVVFTTFLFIPIIMADQTKIVNKVLSGPNDILRKIVDKKLRNCNAVNKLFQINEANVTQTFKDKLNDIYVKLFTANTAEMYYLKNVDNMMNSANYDITKPNVIYFTGYTDNSDKERNVQFGNDIKSSDSVNMIMLDARTMTSEFYPVSKINAVSVAKSFGDFLAKMDARGANRFHLIGHSMGTHIAGMTAKAYKSQTGKTISHITAIDPAGPCYIDELPENKLVKTDAVFVDVIHSNAYVQGMGDPIGHVDFYPNGGTDMPGCTGSGCCHQKGFEYYADSVKNNQYIAVKCSDYETFKRGLCSTNPTVKMGYWLLSNVNPGVYYLKTAATAPYGIGNLGISS